MVSSSQIRKQIVRYINREIDLNAIQLWLVQNTANADFGGSAAVENLTYSIYRVLSEYSERYLSVADMRRELVDLLQLENTVVAFSDVFVPVWKISSAPAVFMTARL